MLDMSQWMVDVTQLLQNRLDADMLAGDVPQEHEVGLGEYMIDMCERIILYSPQYPASHLTKCAYDICNYSIFINTITTQ